VISRDDTEPDIFHVYEKYTGRKAFEEHIASKEFQDFASAGVLAKPPGPKMLTPLEPL
jgi:quinol monooxygenase YgiN